MLYTNFNHIETANQLHQMVGKNENVMIICGRMGTQSIPVYRIVAALQADYPHVRFYDMEYDNPESEAICKLSEQQGLSGLPVIAYYKNGQPIKLTAGMQTHEQISSALEEYFSVTINA